MFETTNLPVRHLFALTLQADTPLRVGLLPSGAKRFIANIMGGTFDGERIRGTVLAGGADWLIVRPDGFAEIDIRMTLETDDGVPIYIASLGLLAPAVEGGNIANVPSQPAKMRTYMRFEAGKGRYDWLNTVVAIALGQVQPGKITYDIFELV